MLDSFYIKNFRLFEELEIKKLSRVNLIVGKNNSGKSALLEAIRIYASNGNPYLMFELVISRQEFSETNGLRRVGLPKRTAYTLRHLFHGHKLPDPGKAGIRLGPLQPKSKRLHLKLGDHKNDTSELVTSIPVLIRESAGKETNIVRMDQEIDERRDWEYYEHMQKFIGSEYYSTKYDEPLPLKSMGDGVFRLLHLILALADAKDGILLVDEFENGLHWSVQPKAWEVIFRLAEKAQRAGIRDHA